VFYFLLFIEFFFFFIVYYCTILIRNKYSNIMLIMNTASITSRGKNNIIKIVIIIRKLS